MSPQILLLRGINVGGHGRLPMADLRDMLDTMGAGGALTQLQSGNSVCPQAIDPEDLSEAIAAKHGHRPMVLSLTVADWLNRTATNPFPTDPAKAVHGFFHSSGTLDTTPMMPVLTSSEGICAAPGVVWLHTPDGIGRSKIAARFERLAGRPVTARNWNTVAAITAMIGTLQNL